MPYFFMKYESLVNAINLKYGYCIFCERKTKTFIKEKKCFILAGKRSFDSSSNKV